MAAQAVCTGSAERVVVDPLSQGVLGAAAPGAIAPRRQARIGCVLGFLAGLAPDLDVFIRSPRDPLLFLEFHRQFTHALIFIPVGGLVCGVLLHWLYAGRRGLSLRTGVLYCTLGYGTHALLDACTTYGTQLLWPFSDQRFAWNTVSVVDPLFTVPMLLLVGAALWQRRAALARLALLWAIAYPTLGLVQRDRAAEAGRELAAARGHETLRLEAKPSFGNLLLWKIVYETGERYHVDAVRAGWRLRVYPGESVAKLDISRDFPWLAPGSQQARDIERFRWFSNGYLAVEPGNPYRITDIRYSMVPNEIQGLWSIELSPNARPGEHVDYVVTRRADDRKLLTFRSMLLE